MIFYDKLFCNLIKNLFNNKMFILRPDSYPNSESPSADHQFGSYKDETSVGANDGTGLFKDIVMDLFQPWANLFTKHSITPSNVKEKASVSQVVEALDAHVTLFAGNVDTMSTNGTYTVDKENKNGILLLESPLTTVTLAAGSGVDDGNRLLVQNNTGGTITLNPGGISLLDDERILLFYNTHQALFDSLIGDNVMIGTLKNNNVTQSTSKDTGSVILEGGIGVEKNIHAGGTIKNDDTNDATSKDTGAIITEGGLGVELKMHAGGTIKSDDSTDSTSKDTGAIVAVNGGIAAELKIHAGEEITSDIGTQRGTAGTVLREKIIDIGDWDMDTFGTASVTHGLGADWKKIRNISFVIRNDSDNNYYSYNPYVHTGGAENIEAGVNGFTSTIITLERRFGGIFDSASFDQTSYNRGWVYILYAK